MAVIKLMDQQIQNTLKHTNKALDFVQEKLENVRKRINTPADWSKDFPTLLHDANNVLDRESMGLFACHNLALFFHDLSKEVLENKGLDYDYLAMITMTINGEIYEIIKHLTGLEDKLEE
jgi:hypothetical protein